MRGARLLEAGDDALVAGHVDLAEHAADLGRDRLALVLLQVEQRDLDALRGERTGGRGAEAGGAAGDDGRYGVVEFHCYSPCRHAGLVPAARAANGAVRGAGPRHKAG